MYVTRFLSTYQRDPSALSLPPPEGPNSGILVIQDEEAQPTCCFGLCNSDQVRDLPFPQNTNLRVEYSTGTGQHRHVSVDRVIFIPVLNLPLSSNQYYCIPRKGKHKGHITDFKPQTCDPHDIYQQFEIRRRNSSGYAANSVAPDGFPPYFLRRKGWQVTFTTPTQFQLTEASGLDKALRARLPDSKFPLSENNSPAVVVGKWYCPFIFIKEATLEHQMDSSRYYEMTLEQRWERIFCCENDGNQGNVDVDVVIETEAVEVCGKAGMYDENSVDGMVWFKSLDKTASVGLSLGVVERMKWEEVRFGWSGEKEVRVKRVDEFGGEGHQWKRFGCYVLVERFVLKRMNGSLVLTNDFKHPQRIITKWE
ncbi:uncharacterized protein [Euphorbia lathyris]|uniref:uncharacterized protein isoform X2 n=1 Tax=Euphorbia lathyris TaxID=212925 RepID=UPI00331440F4